jgi:hypothetical protein
VVCASQRKFGGLVYSSFGNLGVGISKVYDCKLSDKVDVLLAIDIRNDVAIS